MNFRSPIDLTGFALCFWLIFWPKPFALIFCLCAAAPLIAIVWASVRDDVALVESNHPYLDDLSCFWLMPSMALTLRAIGDTHIIDWRWPLGVAAALSLIVSLLMLRLARSPKGPVWLLTLGLPLSLLAWAWGTVILVNAKFDHSRRVNIEAVVLAKHSTHRGRSHLDLQVAGPERLRWDDVAVGGGLFCKVHVGSVLRIELQRGLFGWRNLDVETAVIVPPRQAQAVARTSC